MSDSQFRFRREGYQTFSVIRIEDGKDLGLIWADRSGYWLSRFDSEGQRRRVRAAEALSARIPS